MEDVLEAPAVEEVEAPDTSVETESPDTGDDSTQGEPIEPSGETEGAKSLVNEPLINNGRLSAKAQAFLKQAEATDPKIAKDFKAAIFEADRIRQLFPGGPREVQQFRDQIEQIGGLDGVKEMQSTIGNWDKLDQEYTSGDPAFVKSLAEDTPQEFARMMPQAIAEWQKIDPEGFAGASSSILQGLQSADPDGYATHLAQAYVADMMEQRVPLLLERLQDFIGENPKAMAVWGEIAKYVNRISGLAQKQIPAKVSKLAGSKTPQPSDLDQREQRLREQEKTATAKDWGSASASQRQPIFENEWKRLVGKRELSDAQDFSIREQYRREVMAVTTAPENKAKVERFLAAGDKEGYVRFMTQIYRKEIPAKLQRAFDKYAPLSGKPMPTVKKQAIASPGSRVATADSGFRKVSTTPATHTVNIEASKHLIREGKAILKNGTKVYWDR